MDRSRNLIEPPPTIGRRGECGAHLLDACNPVSAGCPVAVRTIEVGADPVEQAECEFLRLELTQCTRDAARL
jgi:hypothetical protein